MAILTNGQARLSRRRSQPKGATMPTKPKFRERKAWAIVWNSTGEIVPVNKAFPLDIFITKYRAQMEIDSHWHDDCHIQRVRIVKEGK